MNNSDPHVQSEQTGLKACINPWSERMQTPDPRRILRARKAAFQALFMRDPAWLSHGAGPSYQLPEAEIHVNMNGAL